MALNRGTASPRFRVASISLLRQEIARAAHLPGDAPPSYLQDDTTPAQIRYLESYLTNKEVGAHSLLIEEDYVDRHYLHEYVAYYATKLEQPAGRCVRIHVFTQEITEDTLHRWIERLSTSREQLQQEITEIYLGFIVVRPLPFAPVGRTLLRPYPRNVRDRCYEPANTRHRIHILGLDLAINALPFQQQDQAVGACATTALWVALSRVMKADGYRAVTPNDVTDAATRHVVNGRAMPAVAGLNDEQVDSAVRAFGYEPYRFSAEARDSWALFQLALKCYVSSGIPVLLRVHAPGALGCHALVVAGILEDNDPANFEGVKGLERMYYRPIVQVYAHDDRLGAYARMVLDKGTGEEIPTLRFDPRCEGFEKFTEPLDIQGGCVPLYTKLRLTAEDLTLVLSDLLPLVNKLFRSTSLVELRFQLSGDYLADLATLVVEDQERLRSALLCARLSRYVGRIRLRAPNRDWRLDIVCDTTDIYRATPVGHQLLMIFCADATHAHDFRRFCEVANINALVP